MNKSDSCIHHTKLTTIDSFLWSFQLSHRSLWVIISEDHRYMFVGNFKCHRQKRLSPAEMRYSYYEKYFWIWVTDAHS